MNETKELKINKYIKIRLEKNKTLIYINNRKFIQCRFLLTDLPINELGRISETNSVDEIFFDKNQDFYDLKIAH